VPSQQTYAEALYLPVDSGILRFALLVYFVIILILIGIVGDRVCHLRIKLKLLHGEHVDVTHMTGWLKGSSALKVSYQLRRLPCGWLGLSTIFAAILAILSDLGVSAFVRSAPHVTRCPFKEGIVLAPTNAAIFPSNNGAAYLWAANAQLTSYFNGGFLGIYARADNSTGFCAADEDVLGFWNCSINGDPVTYSTADFNDDEIVSDLQKQSLLYENFAAANVTDGDSETRQLVVASASTVSGVADAFDIKAAVDSQDDLNAKTKLMIAYQCLVSRDTDGTIANIHKQIDITSTMSDWILGIQGNMYLGIDRSKSIDDRAGTLEWLLNSMTMVSGGGQSISTLGDPQDTTGCIVTGTQLPGQVSTLFLVVALMAIILTANALWLWLRIFSAKREYDRNSFNPTTGRATSVDSKKIDESTPNGLVDWMQHAVLESPYSSSAGVRPRRQHLRKWLFSVAHHNGQRVGVVSKDHMAVHPTQPMESPMSYRGVGMKEYTAIHTTEVR
jgi:hypothetical protein